MIKASVQPLNYPGHGIISTVMQQPFIDKRFNTPTDWYRNFQSISNFHKLSNTPTDWYRNFQIISNFHKVIYPSQKGLYATILNLPSNDALFQKMLNSSHFFSNLDVSVKYRPVG